MNEDALREDTDSTTDQLPNQQEFIVLADGQTDGGTQHEGQTLHRVTFAPAAAEYSVAAEYNSAGEMNITGIVSMEVGYIVTFQKDEFTRIARLDASFEETVGREFPNAHVLTAADNVVYAAYENGIRTLDTRLESIGTCTLQGEFQDKHMEDIRVHDGVAYIIDDVVFPLFLFRFDVSDPGAPEVIDTIPIEEINQTLQQQWLHPSKDQWGVIQETAHMGGGSQRVYIYNLAVQDPTPGTGLHAGLTSGDGPAFQFREKVCSYTRGDNDTPGLYEKNADGVAIRDVTREPPIYATVTTDGMEYLSSMIVTADAPEGDRVMFDHVVELDGRARVTTLNGYVLVVTVNSQVYCFDPGTESVVAHFDLDITDPLEIF